MAEKKPFKEKEIFTTYDAARICNANIASIKNWIGKGLLRAFRTPGGHYRIRRRDLELFVQKYNMPFSFKEKVRKKVYVLHQDESVATRVSAAAQGHDVVGYGNALQAALAVGLRRPDLLVLQYTGDGKCGDFLEVIQQEADTRNILVVLLVKGLSTAKEAEIRRSMLVEDIIDEKAGPGALIEALSRLL